MTHAIDTGFLVAVEMEDHPDCASANEQAAGDLFALAPQVVAEILHVVTDPKRFAYPLTMEDALDIAERWWTAKETRHLAPAEAAVRDFIDWMRQFRLGRKRLLDTLFATTLRRNGITSILTTNVHDFRIFGGFTFISPRRP